MNATGGSEISSSAVYALLSDSSTPEAALWNWSLASLPHQLDQCHDSELERYSGGGHGGAGHNRIRDVRKVPWPKPITCVH